MKPGAGSKVLASVGLAALLLALAGAAAGTLMIRAGFSTRDEPSTVEAMLARTMRALATPDRVRALTSPRPVTPLELAEARTHWASHCATCHGVSGIGDTDVGRSVYPRAPDMRAAPTQHLTDGQLYALIKDGVRLTAMPAWGAPGDDDLESWALVALIRTFPTIDDAALAEITDNLPRTPHELQEKREEDDFLRSGLSPSNHPEEHHP